MNSGEGTFPSSHSPNAGLFGILWWTAVRSKWHSRLAGTAAILNFQKDFLVPSDCWSRWNSIQATFSVEVDLRFLPDSLREETFGSSWGLKAFQIVSAEHCESHKSGKLKFTVTSPPCVGEVPLLPPSAANQEEWVCEISNPGDKQCDRSLVMTWLFWQQLTLAPLYFYLLLYFHFLLFIPHISFSPQLVKADACLAESGSLQLLPRSLLLHSFSGGSLGFLSDGAKRLETPSASREAVAAVLFHLPGLKPTTSQSRGWTLLSVCWMHFKWKQQLELNSFRQHSICNVSSDWSQSVKPSGQSFLPVRPKVITTSCLLERMPSETSIVYQRMAKNVENKLKNQLEIRRDDVHATTWSKKHPNFKLSRCPTTSWPLFPSRLPQFNQGIKAYLLVLRILKQQ